MNEVEYLETNGFPPAQANLVRDLEAFFLQTGCDPRSFGLAAVGKSDLMKLLNKRRVNGDTVIEVRKYLVAIGGPTTVLSYEDGRPKIIKRKPGDPVAAQANAIRIMKEKPVSTRGQGHKEVSLADELAQIRKEIKSLQAYERKLMKAMKKPN